MAQPAVKQGFSPDDFLAWEVEAAEKHEYLQGEVFAMGGASRRHNAIALNLAAHFNSHLEGTPCRAYMADMKVRVEATQAFFYPDVVVSCDATDHAADLYLTAPVLVVEVLSESTQGYDRGAKFAAYRKLQSLREYVLVDPDSRRIEVFRRNDEGLWVLHDLGDTEALTLTSVAAAIPRERVFHNAD